MLTFFSVLLALGINFYTPEIQKNNKPIVTDQRYFPQFGFPYQYFLGEYLTDKDVNYRIRVIYVSFRMYFTVASFGIPTLGPVVGQVLLPVFSPNVPLEVLISNQANYKTKNAALTAPMFQDKANKVKLTNEQIEIFKKCMDGFITIDEAILELRGGAGLTDLAYIIGFIIVGGWLNSLHTGESFQSVPLPHMDPFGWHSGKYDSRSAGNRQSLAQPPSQFERDTLHTMKQMCAASIDENGFVMSHDEAYNLIKENYSGSMQLTEDLRIGDWQALKHLYHATGVGVNPEDYGITQQELNKIREPGGLIAYVQRGHKLPSIEHVRAYQKALKDICENPLTSRRDDSKYYYKHGITPATVFYNKEGRYIIVFNQTNGDLITGDKQRRTSFDNFESKNILGSKKWIAKWSK